MVWTSNWENRLRKQSLDIKISLAWNNDELKIRKVETRDSKVDYSSEEWMGGWKVEVEDERRGERTNWGCCV